jgi:hypothetical protein
MGMVELRGIVNELIDYQLERLPGGNDYSETGRTECMPTMRLPQSTGLSIIPCKCQAFSEDSSYYLLCSLENVDENGNLKIQGGYVHQADHSPERSCDQRGYAGEALAISIGERGKVDLPYMAELLRNTGRI